MMSFKTPLFWITLWFAGYIIILGSLGPKGLRAQVYNWVPKGVLMVFMLIFIILPPVALPFADGPKIDMPSVVAISLGGVLFAANVIIKVLSQRKIGAMPALKAKGMLVTDGMYKVVRHPLYMSNGLLALGMALMTQSLYALLFSVPYFLSFLFIIHFEEEVLLEQYGDQYLAYKRRVPWRMIPKVL
jgi:protein-S-isoprenylcysteine O-methyltransferase Ste14